MTSKKTKTDFFQDWQALQSSLGKLKKDTANPFFKSKYVPLNQVLGEVKKQCADYNFIFIQTPTMYQGSPSLQTIIRHVGGELIEGNMPLVAKDPNDPQKLGGAMTYMRRYSLVCMFNLEDEDDDGNKSSQPAKEKEVIVWFDPENKVHIRNVQQARDEGCDGQTIVKRIRKVMGLSKENAEKIVIGQI